MAALSPVWLKQLLMTLGMILPRITLEHYAIKVICILGVRALP